MPTQKEYNQMITGLLAKKGAAFNVENNPIWERLINNSMVRDSQGHILRLKDMNRLYDLAEKDALLLFDDKNNNPYIITAMKNGKAPEGFGARPTYPTGRASADALIDKLGVGMKKPSSPKNPFSWIGHGISKLFGGKGNSSINDYYADKAVYDKLVYDRLTGIGCSVQKPANVIAWEKKALARLTARDGCEDLDLSDFDGITADGKVKDYLHRYAVDRGQTIDNDRVNGKGSAMMVSQEEEEGLENSAARAVDRIKNRGDIGNTHLEAAENAKKFRLELAQRALDKLEHHKDPVQHQKFIEDYCEELRNAEDNKLSTFILSDAVDDKVIEGLYQLHRRGDLNANAFHIALQSGTPAKMNEVNQMIKNVTHNLGGEDASASKAVDGKSLFN